MREMLKLPLELIVLKICSATKSTAEKRCFAFLPPRTFSPLPHPSSHQESLKSPRAQRDTRAHAEAPAGGSSRAPLPAIHLRPPSARPRARHPHPVRGQEPQHTVFTWCHAQPWEWPHCSPPPPQPPYIPQQHHSSGFHRVFTHPHCSGNRELMVSAILLQLGFPKKTQPVSSSIPPPPTLQGRHKISHPPARRGFFSSKHQLLQLTQSSWGAEVTGKSPS